MRHPFDWMRDCPGDVGVRLWPPIIGAGRGEVMPPDHAAMRWLERMLK